MADGYISDSAGPLDSPELLGAFEVSGHLSLETETGASVELLIQGGGTSGTTTLVEATGATVTPWTGSGYDLWTYSTGSTRYASTALYNPLSGTARYDVTVPGGLGSAWTFDLQIAPNGTGTRYFFHNTSHYVAAGDPRFALYRSGNTVVLYANGGNRISFGTANGTWRYIRLTYNGTQWALQYDNVLVGTYSDPGRTWTGETYELFGYGTSSNANPMSGYAEDIRITKGLARIGDAPGASMTYPEDLGADAYYGPLQAPQLQGWQQFGHLTESAGPLVEPVQLQGWHQFGYVSETTGPLAQNQQVLGYVDLYSLLSGSESINYALDLIASGVSTRIPIRSWQGTYRLGQTGYMQAVIPNAGQWLSAISAATEFSIYQLVTVDGLDIEYPIETGLTIARKDEAQGSTNYSVVIIGYPDAITDPGDTIDAYDQTLEKQRSIFNNASTGYRVRCKVNYQLRPGHRAWVDGVNSFKVDYINLYAFENDSYMDVGE